MLLDTIRSYNNCQYYIVNCPVEKCKAERLSSGWLLPDGTFFGARGTWAHTAILLSLIEVDFFKDKSYAHSGYKNHNELADDVQFYGGWIRFYGGNDGWLVDSRKITIPQVEFIIDYTIIVDNSDTINCGTQRLKIQTFAKLLDGGEVSLFDLKEGEENSEY